MTIYRESHDVRPTEYYYEYYSRINKENLFLLESFLEITEKIRPRIPYTMIELGGGISILPLIDLSSICKEIHFTDISKLSLKMIQDWVVNKEFFNWDLFFKKSIELQYSENFYNFEYKKESLRKKIKKIEPLDLKSIVIPIESKYDIVSTHFVTECITESFEELELIFQNILHFLNLNGFLIASFYLNGDSLRVGRSWYKILNINEEYLLNLFIKYNLGIFYKKKTETVFHNGYKEIIIIGAQIQNISEESFYIKQDSLTHTLGILNKTEKIKSLILKGMFPEKLVRELMKIQLFNKKIEFFHYFEKNFYPEIIILTRKHHYIFLIYGNYIYLPKKFLEEEKLIKALKINIFPTYNDLYFIKNKIFYFTKLIRKIIKNYEIQDIYKNFLIFTNYNDIEQNKLLSSYNNYFTVQERLVFSLISFNNLENLKKFINDFIKFVPQERRENPLEILFQKRNIDLLDEIQKNIFIIE